jgi:hypothetical protein
MSAKGRNYQNTLGPKGHGILGFCLGFGLGFDFGLLILIRALIILGF